MSAGDAYALVARWDARDARYAGLRAVQLDDRAIEAVRVWRIREAEAIGSARLAEVARTWTPWVGGGVPRGR